jgi:hypothetical protein
VTPWVIGFDLSLTAPAAVALPHDWRPGDWERVKTWTLAPPAPKSKDDLIGQMERYERIAEWATNVVNIIPTKMKALTGVQIYVEAYGYSANNANASRIMESGGIVKALIYRRFKNVMLPVGSSEARKRTLGFNPRRPKYDPKVVIIDTVINKFKAPRCWSEDVCDAFIVAQFGLSEAGGKILALPAPVPIKSKKRRAA